ncbi:hypothetical protein [Microbacterium sp. No. 7]|uniref:hypothetical protein n=1 Tax=Microbacterium sp. No. 7 TaxID=1714373 RepID=UPI0006D0B114|nr:hypothetical protein [Microbacterium sp. No. 7]ALJ21996.1 hypothetical protein AOA12_19700 [Microbacterium sp. No. 7]
MSTNENGTGTGTGTDATMSRADASAWWFFIVIGAAFAVWTVVRAVIRIAEIVPNSDVRVFAQFRETLAEAPIGPDGAPVAVELQTAYLRAPELPVASVGALVIEQVVIAVSVVTTIACLLFVVRSVLRGRMFSRTNTRLVNTAGATALAGFVLAPFFANMGANGAFAWISDRTFDNVLMSVDLTQLFAVAFAAALLIATFAVGERLQRDTEGLV